MIHYYCNVINTSNLNDATMLQFMLLYYNSCKTHLSTSGYTYNSKYDKVDIKKKSIIGSIIIKHICTGT